MSLEASELKMTGVETLDTEDSLDLMQSPFLQLFRKRLGMFCVSMFATMPLTFLLTYTYGALVANAFILIKLCISQVLQHLLWKSLEEWIQTITDPGSQFMHHALKKIHERLLPAKATAFDVMRALPILICAGFSFIFDGIEAIDPDMDTISTSASYSMIKGKETGDQEFRAAWKHIFVVGHVVEYLGLSGVLTAGLIVITAIQMKDMVEYYIGDELSRNDIIKWVYDMHHMSDIAGLMMIRHGLQEILVAGIGRVDRQGSFGTKSILEPGFQGWFQITLTTLSVNTATTPQLLTMAVSIGSSFVAAGKGIVPMAHRMVEWWSDRNNKDKPWRWISFRRNLIPFTLGCILFPTLAVRVVGLWVCESHLLNLTSGCVPVH